MIAINLLPHREWARKKKRERFNLHLGLSALLGAVAGLAIYSYYEVRIQVQEERNRLLQTELAKLDEKIKEIATLQSEIESLKARKNAVQSLQSERNMPVHLLNETVRQLPAGVYLRALKQEGDVVTFTGSAQSQERVSEFLRNLNGQSQWLRSPQLIEITSGTINLNPGGQRRIFNFALRATLRKGGEGSPAETPSNGSPVAGSSV
jgi:type IV pilus assembly protein PilN